MSCRDESGEAINGSIFGRLVAFAYGFGRAGFFLALSLKKESKKEAGRIKASILLMACLLLNGIAFFPVFADGEKQNHYKGRDEHYSRAEKEGEDEGDGFGDLFGFFRHYHQIPACP